VDNQNYCRDRKPSSLFIFSVLCSILVIILFACAPSKANVPSKSDAVPASPVTASPVTLNIANARMSLNGLTSFQWNFLAYNPQSDALYFEGTYLQTNQACQVSAYNGKEKESGVAGYQLLRIGQQQWLGNKGIWVPQKWTDSSYYAEPFYIWTQVGGIGEGSLASSGTQIIGGIHCNKYLFHDIKSDLTLFASVDSGLPIRLEYSTRGTAGQALSEIWEMSHINDPSNVIKPPP
jgi:hypothetical protein